MNNRTIVGLFVCGTLLAGSTSAAQRWGNGPRPAAGACFYEYPDFQGRYFCARAGEDQEPDRPADGERGGRGGAARVPAGRCAGVPAVACGVRAVLRLRLVGLKILKIAGGIDGVRPDKVGLGGQAVPSTGTQADLQRIVDGIRRRLLLVQIEEVTERARYSVGTHAASQIGGGDLGVTRLVDVFELK